MIQTVAHLKGTTPLANGGFFVYPNTKEIFICVMERGAAP